MKKKQAKGITLIALIITIIVLLILAGVAIATLTGDNGIIKIANNVKDISENSKIEEMMNLYKVEIKLENGTETLKDKLIRDGLINSEDLEKNGIAEINKTHIVISDFNGLKKISKDVENGNDYNGKKIYVANDIDCGANFNSNTGELLSGENFNPIGDSNSRIEDEEQTTSVKTEFNGEFDGFDYTIRNLYIKENDETEFCTGLFGYVGENGIVENLVIEDSYIHGYYETGAFVGRNRGKIENCTNKVDVIGDYHLTGGIAGRNIGYIRNCINRGNIDGGSIEGESSQTGGIVGNCDYGRDVIVENCINYGKIQANGNNIGGIVGGMFRNNIEDNNNVRINNCQNYGTVGYNENKQVIRVGGIVGTARFGKIENCTNKGEINGYERVGGIVGEKTSTNIEYCYNYEKVNAIYSRVGGIAGISSGGTISKCGNSGKIYLSEQGHYGAGGIAGYLGSNTEESKIELSYNIGEVYSLAEIGKQTGGIVGNVSSTEKQIKEIISCYNLGYVHGIGYIGGIIGYARDITMQNCYNAGKLEIESGKTGTIGGNIGFLDIAKSTINDISNNYWLSNCGATYGIGTTQSNDETESRLDEELKNLADTLGEDYLNDTNSINNGYPYIRENMIR